jgi:hypothetical protein
MPLSKETRSLIKGYLDGFVAHWVGRYAELQLEDLSKATSTTRNKPFHTAIIPLELLRLSAFERGFSTSLGTTFEECAKLIALKYQAEVHRAYDLIGEVSSNALGKIDEYVELFDQAPRERKQHPSFQVMAEIVLNSQKDSGETRRVRIRSDLFFMSHDGREHYFELKAPQPNKDQCLRAVRRMLTICLLRNELPPKVNTYFAMAYNPYGSSREHYRWSIAKAHLPFDETVLIGHEFWEILGEGTTYDELLEIYQEVGQDKAQHIIEKLAFGF